jgi:hypothetical protein
MIAITSISPTHTNNDIQSEAIKSWISCGLKVHSFNSPAECKTLSVLYPNVKFIETTRTMEATFRKPYVSLSGIFDWCKKQDDEYFCLINSDIELKTDTETIGRIKAEIQNNKIVLANRVNYDVNHNGNRYLDGIDVFFLSKNIIKIYPETLFCLGQCHFDYYIPYYASLKGYELIFLKQNIAYHKNHSAQYNADDWVKTGQHFMWLTDLWQFTNQVGKMSKYVYNYIYNASKRVEI